jgi:hypothetical protein
LDWVYLDHAHDYEGTKRELALLDLKVADSGLILGDDWHIDQSHIHHGVYLAVNEFPKNSDFELVLCGRVCNGFHADRLVLCPVKWSQGLNFPFRALWFRRQT